MNRSFDNVVFRGACALALAFWLAGAALAVAAEPKPRYGVTFGQEGNEVEMQVVPARLGVASNAMPAPADPSVQGIVAAPSKRPTAPLSTSAPATPVELKSESVADYKEDGFDVSVDDVAGEAVANDLDASGKLSLAILFNNDSHEVDLSDAKTMKTLNSILKMMKCRATLKILIEGYVDYTGTMEWHALGKAPDFGQATSEARAYAVKKWLVDNGISSLRISCVGKGMRGAEGDSEAQQKLNRRVDIVKLSE
ncbi:MAG TPA: OmpA family protein [Candidatus Ozemobacteraceae bacterium]|nr:OmpA family protein [Candidatus Ozemobacteraceae bacterium]HQG27370.1 OmpA family protein [Candidatus Ozemobacteraceae bacterium]